MRSLVHYFKIKKSVNFKKKDKLFILSEYEVNNSILAKQNKKKGGVNYLIAESIGFYFNHHPYYKKKKENFIYLKFLNIIFLILGLPLTAQKGQEGSMYLRIKNKFISKIYSRFNIKIARDLPVENYLCKSKNIISNNSNKNIIIFTSNFECFGFQKEEVSIIKKAINICSQKFDKVLVKIHPQDYVLKNKIYKEYQEIKIKNLDIVDNQLTPLEAVIKHDCSYACGSISTSLFDVLSYGCKTYFLFHLVGDIKELQVSKIILENLGYKFVRDVNDISLEF